MNHLKISACIHAYVTLASDRALLLHHQAVIVVPSQLINYPVSFTHQGHELQLLPLKLALEVSAFSLEMLTPVPFIAKLLGEFGPLPI